MSKIAAKDRKRFARELRKKAPAFAAKIAPIYAMLEWKWWNLDKSDYLIPGKKEILSVVRYYINELSSGVAVSMAAGGLCVWIEVNDTGAIEAGLTFRIENNIYE